MELSRGFLPPIGNTPNRNSPADTNPAAYQDSEIRQNVEVVAVMVRVAQQQ